LGTRAPSPASHADHLPTADARRRGALRALVLGTLVGLPLLPHPLIDDDRFDPFHWGAEYAGRPSGIVSDQLGLARFHLEVHGNFRPFGRMLERAQDTLVFVVSDGAGIPVDIVLRGWFALSIGLLSAVVVLAVATLVHPGSGADTAAPRALVLAPFLLPGLMVAGGRQSPAVNFTDIYLQTTALVLLVGMLAARRAHFDGAPVRPLELTVAFVLGLLVAGFNELGTLAAPTAVAFVVARGRFVLGLRPSQLLRTKAVALTGAGLVGFTLLFVPVRLWLAAYCRNSFCHAPSLIRVSEDTPGLLVQRAVSWLPPAGWRVAVGDAVGVVTDAAGVMLLALCATVVLVALRIGRDLDHAGETPPGGAAALAVVGFCLISLGSLLAAVSAYVQTRPFVIGTGWRDTAITATGGALLLGVAASWLSSRSRSWGTAVVTLLTTVTIVTMVANTVWLERARSEPEGLLLSRISVELVRFDDTDEGDARRCGMVDDFLARHPEGSYEDERARTAFDTASLRSHGRAFCGSTS
jgi:hypothetical protein